MAKQLTQAADTLLLRLERVLYAHQVPDADQAGNTHLIIRYDNGETLRLRNEAEIAAVKALLAVIESEEKPSI